MDGKDSTTQALLDKPISLKQELLRERESLQGRLSDLNYVLDNLDHGTEKVIELTMTLRKLGYINIY